jgi:hypothetical protein
MSITLDYVSIEPVPTPIAAQVVAATTTLWKSYDWWAEGISLSQRGSDKRLEGSTRIRLGGYGDVEVPEEEEALMVCKDARFVVSKLVQWSAKHKVAWKLSELETEVGRIVGGKPSAKLSSYLSGLCSDLRLPVSQAPEVLEKHKARKE